MEVKKIKTVNNDGTITEIEVDFDVWQFDKDDYWKQDYQKQKTKKHENSYEEMRRIHEEVYKSSLSEELKVNSSEDEYIKKYENEVLYQAIKKLPQKQKQRIILRFFYNLKISEIANIENCTERAIYIGISNSIQFLKDFLQKNNN